MGSFKKMLRNAYIRMTETIPCSPETSTTMRKGFFFSFALYFLFEKKKKKVLFKKMLRNAYLYANDRNDFLFS